MDSAYAWYMNRFCTLDLAITVSQSSPLQKAWEAERAEIQREREMLREAHLARGATFDDESDAESEGDEFGHDKEGSKGESNQEDHRTEEENSDEGMDSDGQDRVEELDLSNF